MCGLQSLHRRGTSTSRGRNVTKRTADLRKKIGRVVSVVIQNPATALNPRMALFMTSSSTRSSVTRWAARRSAEARERELFGLVGLPSSGMWVTAWSAFRWSAPACGYRPCASRQPGCDHRRRADLGPRRLGARADPQPATDLKAELGLAMVFISRDHPARSATSPTASWS